MAVIIPVASGSYAIAGLAYAALTAVLLIGRGRRSWPLLALAGVGLVWAGLGAQAAWLGQASAPARLADLLRQLSLLAVASAALCQIAGMTFGQALRTGIGALLLGGALGGSALALSDGWADGGPSQVALLGQVWLAVTGLVLVENLFAASRPSALWQTKHLVLAIGSLCAFDLFLYADALLLLRLDETMRLAQPMVAALTVPLILIGARRLRQLPGALPVSRAFVLSTTALLASGIYFLLAALIAYLIRGLGWGWGPTLQLVFLIGAGLVLLTLFGSTALRQSGRRLLERNLFTLAYDYRREWLRLVAGMADGASGRRPDQRAIKVVADLLDAEGGALFLTTPQAACNYAASWQSALSGSLPAAVPAALLDQLGPAQPLLPLPPEPSPDPTITAWLAGFNEPWLLLGLHASQQLQGVIVVTKPRFRRPLTWEDRDLLAIFANQIGSYLAVEQLAHSLAEAEHFERLHKQVGFIAHDLKTLISQLSLILQQASRHGDNPAFIQDSFLTIRESVQKMTDLMQRLRAGASTGDSALVDLSSLVLRLHERGRCNGLDGWAPGVLVRADPAALAMVLEHLLDNGRAACGPAGRVALALRQEQDQAVLEVIDSGVGMSREFIETTLFRPFASTKATGFGLGMYQCRDWIERWQGRLAVDSREGHGTTMRILLPLALAGAPAAASPRAA